jgi:hypothetical protein
MFQTTKSKQKNITLKLPSAILRRSEIPYLIRYLEKTICNVESKISNAVL